MIRRSAAALMLMATSTSVAGAMEVRDLRFGLGFGPTPDHNKGTFTPNDGSAPFPTDDSYGSGKAVTGAVSATYGMLDPLGLLCGIELRYSNGQRSMDALSGVSLEGHGAPLSSYTEADAALHAGLGWALGLNDHIEAVGLIGFAWAQLESPANTSGNVSAQKGQGNGTITGARIGWFHTWTSNWQIGLQAEWTTTEVDLTTNYVDGTLESNLRNSGFGGRAVLGYRH